MWQCPPESSEIAVRCDGPLNTSERATKKHIKCISSGMEDIPNTKHRLNGVTDSSARALLHVTTSRMPLSGFVGLSLGE
jgi:hypothetical protein